MKKQITIGGAPCFHEPFVFACWNGRRRRQQNRLKRLLKHYQEKIDLLLAATTIGLMFLVGSWLFLVELAAFGFH